MKCIWYDGVDATQNALSMLCLTWYYIRFVFFFRFSVFLQFNGHCSNAGSRECTGIRITMWRLYGEQLKPKCGQNLENYRACQAYSRRDKINIRSTLTEKPIVTTIFGHSNLSNQFGMQDLNSPSILLDLLLPQSAVFLHLVFRFWLFGFVFEWWESLAMNLCWFSVSRIAHMWCTVRTDAPRTHFMTKQIDLANVSFTLHVIPDGINVLMRSSSSFFVVFFILCSACAWCEIAKSPANMSNKKMLTQKPIISHNVLRPSVHTNREREKEM